MAAAKAAGASSSEALRRLAGVRISKPRSEARRALLNELNGLVTARVEQITVKDTDPHSMFYFGIAWITAAAPSLMKQRDRRVFFNSNCRSMGSGLLVAGIVLTDPSIRPTSTGSIPMSGDLITGYISQHSGKNGDAQWRYSAWVPRAKPLGDLRYIVQNGTREHPKSLRHRLRWMSSRTEDALWALCRLVLNDDLHLFAIRDCIDNDVDCEGLYDDSLVAIAKSLKLGLTADRFIENVAIRLGDERLLEEWHEIHSAVKEAARPATPPYNAATPPYNAAPVYDAAPVYAPTSPAYMPASPVYCPSSPAYTPSSPSYVPEDLSSEAKRVKLE